MHYLILTVFFFLWFHRNACEKVRGGNSCMWGLVKTGEFHFFLFFVVSKQDREQSHKPNSLSQTHTLSCTLFIERTDKNVPNKIKTKGFNKVKQLVMKKKERMVAYSRCRAAMRRIKTATEIGLVFS